ncbi:hypothetical protein BT63DRAFT_428155 [Microthyrium microscopicum]|uniref:DUF7165 domain-containing protein n=1 Tax=Microthyrium microscopicum TaxID=703497 RepID=A0A6A6U268_9PEZI|nr:hypothetical protein BT63DRAFT_428155 [Microthyrium microscopicum]
MQNHIGVLHIPNDPKASESDGPDMTSISTMSSSSDGVPQSSLPTSALSVVDAAIPQEQESNPTSPRSPTYSPCHTTVVDLVSISATSSAFPESFGLSVSSKGRWLVAYSSAALYILLAQDLPNFKNHCRAFRLRRRPLAVVITDVGKYAVLTNAHKIDVYQCGDGSKESISGANDKLQTILLDNDARTIAISASGELVAAGSENGLEIIGLGLPSGSDRRQINCGSVESASFSGDGKSLLVTAPARKSRTSIFLTTSGGFDQGMLMEDEEEEEPQPIANMWISQLLFPEKLQARQAVFLPDPSSGQTSELLAIHSQWGRFGLFDAALKNFTGKSLGIPDEVAWSETERFEDTLPGVSSNGSQIATAVRLETGGEIWTYKLPTGWRDEATLDAAGAMGLAPVQRLVLPSKGNAASPETVSCLKWLQLDNAPIERLLALVVTAPLGMPEDVEPIASPAASGRVVLFDFKRFRLPATGSDDILVDLDEIPLAEELAEEQVELEREVDIVRRRTQVQRNQTRRNRDAAPPMPNLRIRRSASSASRTSSIAGFQEVDLRSNRPRRRRSFSSVSDVGSEETEFGPGVAVDEPYSQSAPRPQFMLNRAATVAQHAPSSRMHLRSAPSRPLEYRRADGMREIPHESDADNWVPPPPPYSATPDAPGPNATSFPITAIPGMAERVLTGGHVPERPPQPHGMRSRVSRVISGVQVPILPHQQAASRANPPTNRSNTTTNRNSTRYSTHNPPNIPVQPAQPSREPTSRVIRRPVPTTTQSSHASISRLPSNAPHPPQLRTGTLPGLTQTPISSPTAPVPGTLNSPFTFPGGHRRVSSGGSILRIPHAPALQAASAPVTPISQHEVTPPQLNRFSQQYRTPPGQAASSIPSTPVSSQSNRVSLLRDDSPLAPPNPQFAVRNSRRVSSAELMRPLPPPPQTDASDSRHSSDMPHGSYSTHTAVHRPIVDRISTAPQHTMSRYAEPQTPSSRRHWWRVGSTPTRPAHASTPSGSRTATPMFGKQEEKSSRCTLM